MSLEEFGYGGSFSHYVAFNGVRSYAPAMSLGVVAVGIIPRSDKNCHIHDAFGYL